MSDVGGLGAAAEVPNERENERGGNIRAPGQGPNDVQVDILRLNFRSRIRSRIETEIEMSPRRRRKGRRTDIDVMWQGQRRDGSGRGREE